MTQIDFAHFNLKFDFVRVNKKLQKKFKCIENISVLLYGELTDKFKLDFETNKAQLNKDCVTLLNDYSVVKKLVSFQADKSTQLIDITLLKQMISQIDQRYNLAQILRKHGKVPMQDKFSLDDVFDISIM